MRLRKARGLTNVTRARALTVSHRQKLAKTDCCWLNAMAVLLQKFRRTSRHPLDALRCWRWVENRVPRLIPPRNGRYLKVAVDGGLALQMQSPGIGIYFGECRWPKRMDCRSSARRFSVGGVFARTGNHQLNQRGPEEPGKITTIAAIPPPLRDGSSRLPYPPKSPPTARHASRW